MNVYKNNYFNIELEFPKEWRIWSCSSKGGAPKSRKLPVKYQSSDDDIPKSINESKLLFSSLFVEKNVGTISAELSIAVYLREDYLNLDKEVSVIDGDKKRVLNSETILGSEAQSLFIIRDSGSDLLWRKIVAWEEQPNTWLEAVMHGSSEENFDRAESIFQNLKRNKS